MLFKDMLLAIPSQWTDSHGRERCDLHPRQVQGEYPPPKLNLLSLGKLPACFGQGLLPPSRGMLQARNVLCSRELSALVGASLLNLVDAVIREQGSLPPDQRRGALVVVDEMQTMPGVDYESMLSELGKFGASFILATQSLAKLDDLSPTMRDTILANVGQAAL